MDADGLIRWDEIRTAILVAWEAGFDTNEIRIKTEHRNAKTEFLATSVIYKYARRIYSEWNVRTPAMAIAEAYRRGILACPCSGPVRACDVSRYT